MGSASALADEEGRKLFLGGLSYDAREDDLKTDFGKYGELEDVQLPWGEGGKHKGFAFITYKKAEDAEYAAKEHHQREYLGREISAKIVTPNGGRRGGDRGGDRGGGRGGGGLPPLSRENEDKLEQWVSAKRQRDFETADRLRAELNDAGVNAEEYRPKPGANSFGGGGGYGGGGGGGRYDDRGGGGRYDDRDRYDDRRRDDRYDDRRRDDRYDDRRRDDRHDDRRRDDRYDDRRDDRRDDRDRYRERSPEYRR